jgi:predicted lipase
MIALTGCSNSIKPVDVIVSDFDISEAEAIMKRTWKPVKELTNANLETRPDVQISSKEDFFNRYSFTYMDEMMKTSIFESIVDIGQDGQVIKDDKGNLVFGEGNIITYVPTIYDEGIFIRKAYLRDSRYKEEYESFNVVELVIEEESNDKIIERAEDFYRTDIFRKNEEGQWILYMIEGTGSIAWER